MARQEVVVYMCDGCGKESQRRAEIVNHAVGIDGAVWSVDACESCWTDASLNLGRLLEGARMLAKPRAKRRRAG